MVDTPTGETGDQKPLENENNTPSVPTVVPTDNTVDLDELNTLRKEKEQAEMRANQLANENKAIKEAEEARKAKELEEQNEFKTLFEQEKTKREELEAQQTQAEAEKARSEAEATVLAGFPQGVQELATEAGIALPDSSEEAQASFKEKLGKIEQRVAGTVTPNNPAPAGTAPTPSEEELANKLQTQEGFDEMISKTKPGIAAKASTYESK